MGHDTLEDKYWLYNNLLLFTDKLNIEKRFLFPAGNTSSYKYFHSINNADIKTRINILFRIMTPIERYKFLNSS